MDHSGRSRRQALSNHYTRLSYRTERVSQFPSTRLTHHHHHPHHRNPTISQAGQTWPSQRQTDQCLGDAKSNVISENKSSERPAAAMSSPMDTDRLGDHLDDIENGMLTSRTTRPPFSQSGYSCQGASKKSEAGHQTHRRKSRLCAV